MAAVSAGSSYDDRAKERREDVKNFDAGEVYSGELSATTSTGPAQRWLSEMAPSYCVKPSTS